MTANRLNRSLNELLRSPGRLCVNPTDLSTDYPHGGTDLGNIRKCFSRPVLRYYRVRAEEFGGRMVERTHFAEGEIVSVVFRGMNDEALQRSFPNSEEGDTTGHRLLFSPAADDDNENRDGTRDSERAFSLCFSPDDRDNGVTVLLQKCLPMLEESYQLALQAKVDVEHAVVFETIPTIADARPWQAGHWQDITIGAP